MTGRESTHHWYRLTPDRFLLGLFTAMGFLLLSERFRWFAFNEHKGWTVLIAIEVVGMVVVLLPVWFGVSLAFRRRLQFSIRSLLLFVVLVAVVCSWFAVKMQQARRQREAVAAIGKAGGRAAFDYLYGADGSYLPGQPNPPGPRWLRSLVGVDFFSDVRELHYEQATDAGLVHLQGLTSLQDLWLANSQVTDAGLVHLERLTSLQELWLEHMQGSDAGLVCLKGLTSLQELHLWETRVTDEGVEDLQRALPNCQISRSLPPVL